MALVPTPFELLYTQMVADLRAMPEIAELVKARNLIAFENRNSPEKAQIQSADVPELVLYMSNVRGNLHESSSTVRLVTTWSYIISSGTFDSSVIGQLMLGMLRGLVKWKETLHPLEWSTRRFVQDVRLVTSDVGLSNPKANRNITGWSTMAQAEIEISLLITDVTTIP